MDLITLFWIALFVGGGAGIGNYVFGLYGSFVGGAGGYLLLYLWSSFNSWSLRQLPSCKCGNSDFEKFSIIENEEWGHFHKCNECSSTYIMRKGNTCSEVTKNNESIPYMKRNLNQKWYVIA